MAGNKFNPLKTAPSFACAQTRDDLLTAARQLSATLAGVSSNPGSFCDLAESGRDAFFAMLSNLAGDLTDRLEAVCDAADADIQAAKGRQSRTGPDQPTIQ